MKIAAKNKLRKMERDLEELAQKSVAKKEWEKKEGIFHKDKYSREVRWQDYIDEQERKEKEEKEKEKNTMFKEYREYEKQFKNRGPPERFKKNGDVLQCNQGGYEWSFTDSEDRTQVVFTL